MEDARRKAEEAAEVAAASPTRALTHESVRGELVLHVRGLHVKETYTCICKIYKITKITKYELWNSNIIQNRSLKSLSFSFSFFCNFTFFHKDRMYFGIVGLFCIINVYFEYRIQILCIELYMGT